MRDLFLLFLFTVITSVLGNVRTILMVKNEGRVKYLLTLVDTAIYAYLIGVLGRDNSPIGIAVFTTAKLLGLYITDFVTNKIDRKIYQINLYLKKENFESMKEYLVENNLSFTKFTGDFLGEERCMISMHTSKKQKASLLNKLSELGISPTMDISEVKVDGKISTRV